MSISADYSRSVTHSPYLVAGKQVVFCPLGGTMFWQFDYHALRKGRATLLETFGQKHSRPE